MNKNIKKLNLGCGINWKKYEDYEGLDIDNYGQKYAGNVLELLKTFKNEEYAEVMANHFLEHFDQDDLKIIFTEVNRILKPKGLFRISVPHKNRERAWDLTHKTFWNENTVIMMDKIKGFGKWKVKELVIKRRNIHAILNKREKYTWDYLKQIEPRGERMYKIISPHIEDKHKVILEMDCGFSPLYHYLQHHTYFGFDNNKECISCLKDNHPSGNWQLCKSKHYKVEVKPDILLLLGATDGTFSVDDQKQNMVLEKIVKEYLPEIVVVEYHRRISIKDIKDIIVSNSYKVLISCSYNAGLRTNSERDIIIFKYDK